LDLILILLAAGCGLIVALTVGAVVLLKLGVLAKYALQPERPEDKLGDYGLEESHEVEDRTQQT
jgi:hypothetical protein